MPELERHLYDAFVSYRHVEPNRRWAKWLHRTLETFKTPKPLIQKGVPSRIPRVFRDEDELPASADLSTEIDQALEQSRFLIVVCSPRAPQSEWVNQEVVRFREMGRHGRILALLIEGEPREAFPRALCEIRTEITNEQGEVSEEIEDVEPLAADVRPSRAEGAHFLKRMARLRFAAALLGWRFDDLRQREQERRTRRLAWLSVAALALVGILVALSLAAISESNRADARADEATALLLQSYKDMGRSELIAGWPLRATPYLTAAYARGKDDPVLRFLLAQSCRPLDALVASLEGHTDAVTSALFSPDGTRVATTSDDNTARLWDAGAIPHSWQSCGHRAARGRVHPTR